MKNALLLKDDFKNALVYRTDEQKLISKLNTLELNMSKHKHKKEVTKKDVAYILNMKTNIPIYELLEDNIKIIKNISMDFYKNIIGEDTAIKACIDVIKRIKLGFRDNSCYSMMFTGPSGVGKTCLATLFAKALTGGNLIKIDGTEYSEASSITKLIGSNPGYVGYDDYKNILEEVKNNPFSVILLDEVDKMHRDVISLFMQILEDGKIKNSKGEYVYFNNTVIIMTSNVGYLNNSIGFNDTLNKKTKLNENFSIPFMNRVDNIIYFNSLNEENIKKIINNKLNILKKKYKNKNVNLKINNNIINDIVEKSEYLIYGARKIDKIIKDDIENIIIDNILNNQYDITIKSLKVLT